ncbi:COMM domain-containing protein 1, partial [Podarcis lilfordi]
MAAAADRPPAEAAKPLLGLLNGIAQATYYGNAEITEELLRDQLYPETAPQEFRALLAKTTGVVKGLGDGDMDGSTVRSFWISHAQILVSGFPEAAAQPLAFKCSRLALRDGAWPKVTQSNWQEFFLNYFQHLCWDRDPWSSTKYPREKNTPLFPLPGERDRQKRQ